MIQLEKLYEFKKGMIINCSLKNADEVKPPQVNYTWFSCESGNCDDETNWSLERKSYSLKLNSQTRENMKYRCIAENAAGRDFEDITVFNPNSKLKRINTSLASYVSSFYKFLRVLLLHNCLHRLYF